MPLIRISKFTAKARRPPAAGPVTGPRRGLELGIVGAAVVALLAAGGSAWASSAGSSPAASSSTQIASGNPGAAAPASAMATSAEQLCARVATKAGFSYARTVSTAIGKEPQIVVAISVALAESSCIPSAVYHDPNGSEDRGLWQINNAAWPGVSDKCAYDAQCNGDAAWMISKHGADWGPWSTYASGKWEQYVGDAKAAVTSSFSFMLKDQKAGTCLAAEVSQAKNGGAVEQQTCNGKLPRQQWTALDSLGHMPVLRNNATKLCLDIDPSQTGNGGKIYQWACDKTATGEQWAFDGSAKLNANGDAEAGLRNDKDSKCLDVDSKDPKNGGPVFQWACSGSDTFQLWN
jgi:hypothetical protein